MNVYRIWALMLRHLKQTPRDVYRLSNLFYWPLVDIILWGFTGRWIQMTSNDTTILISFLMCLLFWQIVMRSHLDIANSFLEELWSHNVGNLFSTPLSIGEWTVGVIGLAAILSVVSFVFCLLVIYPLYGIPLWKYFTAALIPAATTLFFAGLAIGFLSAAVLVYFGKRIESFVFMAVWLFAPFSGVFYAIEALPEWAQTISVFLPTTRALSLVRLIAQHRPYPTSLVVEGLSISIVWFIATVVLFVVAFHKRRNLGLARLDE